MVVQDKEKFTGKKKDRHKARFAAKHIKKELTTHKHFSPVSTKDAFRINMASDAHYNLELHQMDVKIAFLNGDLNEEICMCPLECFGKTGDEHKVYKLKNSIRNLYMV